MGMYCCLSFRTSHEQGWTPSHPVQCLPFLGDVDGQMHVEVEAEETSKGAPHDGESEEVSPCEELHGLFLRVHEV